MRTAKLTGIIIKRTNFGEASRYLTVFSRQQGKIRLLAKGIRKIKSRRAPHLELFNLTEFLIYKDTITEAKVINDFRLPKSDLRTAGYLFYLAEVLDKIMPEHQPQELVFDKLVSDLEKLENLKDLKRMVLELIWDLGYLPRGSRPRESLTGLVESIVERKIRSKKFLEQI